MAVVPYERFHGSVKVPTNIPSLPYWDLLLLDVNARRPRYIDAFQNTRQLQGAANMARTLPAGYTALLGDFVSSASSISGYSLRLDDWNVEKCNERGWQCCFSLLFPDTDSFFSSIGSSILQEMEQILLHAQVRGCSPLTCTVQYDKKSSFFCICVWLTNSWRKLQSSRYESASVIVEKLTWQFFEIKLKL